VAAVIVCISQINYVTSFTKPCNTSPPVVSTRILPKIPLPTTIPVLKQQGMTKTSSSLHLYVPSLDDIHALTTATPSHAAAAAAAASASSVLLSTIDSDIANIPENEFRTVFAGGIGIMFGSILSTIFVGYLIESPGGGGGKKGSGYVDLVAETYVEQSSIMGEREETFLNSLGLVRLYNIIFIIISPHIYNIIYIFPFLTKCMLITSKPEYINNIDRRTKG
jgi:hypothetical protein